MNSFIEFQNQGDLWEYASSFVENEEIIGVSGGSAGQLLKYVDGKTWFLVDERKVDYDSDECNCRILRSYGDDEVKCMYHDEDFLDVLPERLQTVAMGIGADGHIASLFPGTDFESDSIVVDSFAEGYETEERISLSMNYLLKSERVVFVLLGERKKDLWEKLKNNQMGNSPIDYFLRNFSGKAALVFSK